MRDLRGRVVLDGREGGGGVLREERVGGDILLCGGSEVECRLVVRIGQGVGGAHLDGGRVAAGSA